MIYNIRLSNLIVTPLFICTRVQSETVEVIPLLAVFVLSASAIGVAYVGDVGGDADDLVASAYLGENGTDLSVSHLEFDTVPNEDLAAVVRADGNATRYSFAPLDGQFAPGTERTFSDALVVNAPNEVRLYHESSGTQIERDSFTPKPAAETGSIEGPVSEPGAVAMRFTLGGSSDPERD